MNNGQLLRICKRLALYGGILMFAFSIFMSYDGFDGSVNGENPKYAILGIVIGITLAFVGGLLQFIFAIGFKDINNTLRFLGIISYAYSLYTNQLGAQHLLGMSKEMAWITACFFDLAAEPLVAWGLGELSGSNLFDNIMSIAKSTIGVEQKEQPKQEYKPPQEYKPLQEFRQQPVQFTNRSQPQQGGFQQIDLLNRLPKRK